MSWNPLKKNNNDDNTGYLIPRQGKIFIPNFSNNDIEILKGLTYFRMKCDTFMKNIVQVQCHLANGTQVCLGRSNT